MIKKFISAISIILLFSGLCAAATPVDLNDFSGTSWVIYGKTRVSISGFGGGAVAGVGYFNFDPGGAIRISDTTGCTISGTYGIDARGKFAIVVDEQDIQNFFDNYFSQALDDAGLSGYIDNWWVDVTAAKSTTAVVYKGDMITLRTTISARAKITLEFEDAYGNPRTLHLSESFSISMAGDHPTAGTPTWASKWDIAAKATLTAKKVKVNKVMNLELTVGDLESSGLSLNQYRLVDPNSTIFSSDMLSDFCWSKNKLYFWGDESYINATIENIILENNSNVEEVYIDMMVPKVTATVRSGKKESINLTGTITFWATIYYTDGSDADTRGTLKLSGKGVPAQ